MAAFDNLTMVGNSLFRGDAATPFYSPANALKGLLTAGGHTATFVGDQSAFPGSIPVCSVGGRKISDLLANISTVTSYSPKTLIISIGTNELSVEKTTVGTEMTSYLNALESALGAGKTYYVLAPNNLSWFHQASWNLLRGAMEAWCASRSNAFFGDITNAALDIGGSDGIGAPDYAHWSNAGANKAAAYIYSVMAASVVVAPVDTATASVFKGFDVASLIATAAAQPKGLQKAKFCADVAAALGSNALYGLRAGGTVVYQTTISGALTSSAAGIPMPTQFVEPPTVNTANALTTDAVEFIRNASNPAVEVSTPIKAGGGTGFLTASKALNGTYLVRTSGRILKAPNVLDVGGDEGSTTGIYKVSTLVGDMFNGNDNGWYMEAAPNTNDNTVSTGKYPYVAIGLRKSDNNSYWPGEYISDAAPRGQSLSDSTNVFLLPWYVVGRAAQVPNGADNTRVQMRNHKLMGMKYDNTWETIGVDEAPISGSSWHANFRSPGNEKYEGTSAGGALSQIRSHTAADGGGESLGSIGYGNDGAETPHYLKWTNHGYNVGTTKTKSQWINGYKWLVYVIEARLIKHDPSGADNRANAGLMMWMGADWYKNNAGSGNYINEHCHGRLKVITNDWKIFSCGEFKASDVQSYPPPGYS